MAARKKGTKKAQERNLTRELSALLAKVLRPSLEERAKQASVAGALTAQYEAERKANRTAEKRDEWVERTLEQVGVAWILSCVFVRTLEDRGYLSHARIAGEGAADSEHLFFDQFPSLTQRDYLLAVFRELSHVPGGEDVLGPKHNPAWRLAPSTEAVRELLTFLRETDAEGRLQWRFGGEDTRFLGDLYQDISEAVRERYALLQTPGFVEEFILDLTLDPAIAEYGLEEVRLLDPTCGSGHFLLGAFKRLFEARQRKAPGKPVKEHAFAALGQVYGVDVNPYAAAIARFRLVLAYMRAAEIDKLKNAPRLPSNVVVADSLLFGAKDRTLPFAAIADDSAAWGEAAFQFADPKEAARVLGQHFHAVVGNPPYITCKDSNLRNAYRKLYRSCHREYALAAPFTERFFQLASQGSFVGMINANSFMKREFGKKLIEEVLSGLDLAKVVDAAGVYIPGHGTPTVLLFGRNRAPVSDKVLAVLGKRGEPEVPRHPEKGLVWASIREHIDEVGFENEYVSIAEIPRETLHKHPWSLGGGGASELKLLLDSRASCRLADLVELIGFGAVTREDEVFVLGPGGQTRLGLADDCVAAYVNGEGVRDWSVHEKTQIVFPYDRTGTVSSARLGRCARLLWLYRTQLWLRQGKGFKTKKDSGGEFYEYSMFYPDRFYAPRKIAFAEVATNNHFVLDRGGKVFGQTAPIIKLPEGATEDDHVALLAYLNSSTVDFYVRQVAHNKGAQGINAGIKSEAWEQFLARNASVVGSIPLPPRWRELTAVGRSAEALAAELASALPTALKQGGLQDDEAVSRNKYFDTMKTLVAVQEQIDWTVYGLWGLTDGEIPDKRSQIEPGDRAFERSLYRSQPETRWFALNGYELPTMPGPPVASKEVAIIEQPESKRRWALANWDGLLEQAFNDQQASGIEDELRASRRATSVRTLIAGIPSRSAPLSHGKRALSPERVIDFAAVPYLSALRFSDSGLAKRGEWEKVWTLQRREDAGEKLEIPVPPKYDSKDFRDPTYWRLRGKLDVPKERFISYPGAEKDDDKSPLFGWAGWDHLQQATALAGLYHERKTEEGWPPDRLVPLLAGLLELLPWLKQWHNEPTDELGGEGAGDWYERYIDAETRSLGKSRDDLRDWRPAKGARGRKK